jgi:serine protease Do
MRSLLLLVAMSVGAFAQPAGQNQFWVQSPSAEGQVWAFNQAPSPMETLSIHSTGSFLGVGIADINAERARELKLSEERGVLISHVDTDSPASKAGLQVGDVLLEYNGQRIDGIEQFGRFVRETPAGRRVKLSVWRAAKPLTIEAVIENRKMRMPSATPMPQNFSLELPGGIDLMRNFPRPELAWRNGVLGIECQSIADQLAEYFGVKQGVLVLSVAKDSPAAKAGLKAGDVITKIGERQVATPSEIISAVHERSSKDLKVGLMRDRKETSFNVTLDENSGWGHRNAESKPVALQP